MVVRTVASVALIVSLAAGCTPRGAALTRPPAAGSTKGAAINVLEVVERLEDGIEAGTAGDKDRERAYQQVSREPDDGSAAYAFARAAVAGRLAEMRGVGAGRLVTEAETYVRLALERDPDYGDGDAVRMLGTLYVMAPRRLVEHGDAEEGLSMLESLVAERPDDPRNHLRVAEAYIALDDPEPAAEFLCRAQTMRSELRRDDQRLLDTLAETFGGSAGLRCE